MQIEEQKSDQLLFDATDCFVTANGELKQKDNQYFTGKTLAADVKEPFEDAINPYREAFDTLKAELLEQAKQADGDDSLFDNLLKKAGEAKAIGDFNALLDEIKQLTQKDVAADTTKDESTQVTEPEEPAGSENADPEESADTSKPAEKKAEQPQSDAPEAPAAEESIAEDTPDTQPKTGEAEPAEETTDPQEPQADAPEAPAAEESKTEDTPDTQPKTGETEPAEETAEPEKSGPDAYYNDLAKEAEALAKSNRWSTGISEFDELYQKWSDGPELGADQLTPLRKRLDEAKQKFTERKTEHHKKQEERKEKNFQVREQLLARFQKIIDQKKWGAQRDVNNMQRKFENARPLPAGAAEDQDKTFKELLSVFDSKRVDYLVEERQKEEDNLTGKLITIEKIESLLEQAGEKTENWEELESELQTLNRQWRKIGHVPKEKEKEIREKFRATQNTFIEKRLKFDKNYKKIVNKGVDKREKLIKNAEGLCNTENLADAAREINKLHAAWKKLDNIPQELSDELWERFKAASDNFNKIKNDNIDKVREQERENLKLKEQLCEEAEKLAESDDFRSSGNKMQSLLDKWKKVGPVHVKKENPVWRRFRKAMDAFYSKRREHFKELKSEQQDNLNRKKEIVAKIKELAESEDMEAALKEVQALQEEFKKIGFVPIKWKDKIRDQFREAGDIFYNKLRGSGGGKHSSASFDKTVEKKITSELFKLRKESDRMREEILKYEDTMTYFKPNKKGMELRNEIQSKVDAAEKILTEKAKRIEELQKQLDEL